LKVWRSAVTVNLLSGFFRFCRHSSATVWKLPLYEVYSASTVVPRATKL
jgi:hypothetical protein